MNRRRALLVGTRGSALALWQAEWVKSQLLSLHQDLAVELIPIKTTGDKTLDVPLARVGGKGLFVKEIEAALLAGRVDMAVHSMKDVPAELPVGLQLAAMPVREDARDVLVSRDGRGLGHLPRGARVGTSSLRRSAQLYHLRRDLKIEPLRGNLDTRLRKLETEHYDAVVVAAAGLRRMGLTSVATEFLSMEQMLPAAGQGALGIETRIEDSFTNQMVGSLAHEPTMTAVSAERAFLRRLGGGCQVPIGAYAIIEGKKLILTGMVADIRGECLIRRRLEGEASRAWFMGRQLAEKVLEAGGAEILAEIYEGR